MISIIRQCFNKQPRKGSKNNRNTFPIEGIAGIYRVGKIQHPIR